MQHVLTALSSGVAADATDPSGGLRESERTVLYEVLVLVSNAMDDESQRQVCSAHAQNSSVAHAPGWNRDGTFTTAK